MTEQDWDFFPDDPPQFQIGELVKHCRYHYRGVVVDFDMRCMADEDWYLANKTQPERDQPWYHVLIDGSNAVSYAAQTSLEEDPSDQPVHHPLVTHLFERFDQGWYERNDRPWPGFLSQI